MPPRSKPFKVSPTNPSIKEIQTEPERHMDMPYAPAMRIEAPGDLLFISGATCSPLYHKHPHIPAEHQHPNDMKDQSKRVFDTIASILAHEGLTWTDVVKLTRYLTDMRDMDELNVVQGTYLKDWKPISTTVCDNQLSTPGARIEIEAMAVFPRA